MTTLTPSYRLGFSSSASGVRELGPCAGATRGTEQLRVAVRVVSRVRVFTGACGYAQPARCPGRKLLSLVAHRPPLSPPFHIHTHMHTYMHTHACARLMLRCRSQPPYISVVFIVSC